MGAAALRRQRRHRLRAPNDSIPSPLIPAAPRLPLAHNGGTHPALCGTGIRITDPGEVRDGLARALAMPGPVLVDVVTDPNALSMPPNITAQQIRGFAMAAGRTVLAGGVGKMLDLARSNLRNIRALEP